LRPVRAGSSHETWQVGIRRRAVARRHDDGGACAATKLELVRRTGPVEFLDGIEADLAELCIGPAKK